MAHAHRDLVDQAGRVAGVLDRVARRALRRHQVGHGARGAQGGGGRVGVEGGLAGQVRGSQVRVDISGMGGAVVMEGVGGLSGDGGGDVGLLPPVAPASLGHHVLLSLGGGDRRKQGQLLRLREPDSRSPPGLTHHGLTYLAEVERLLLEGVRSGALLSVGPAPGHAPQEVIIAGHAVGGLELVRGILMVVHGICGGKVNGEGQPGVGGGVNL